MPFARSSGRLILPRPSLAVLRAATSLLLRFAHAIGQSQSFDARLPTLIWTNTGTAAVLQQRQYRQFVSNRSSIEGRPSRRNWRAGRLSSALLARTSTWQPAPSAWHRGCSRATRTLSQKDQTSGAVHDGEPLPAPAHIGSCKGPLSPGFAVRLGATRVRQSHDSLAEGEGDTDLRDSTSTKMEGAPACVSLPSSDRLLHCDIP